jgi:hypothetical protein
MPAASAAAPRNLRRTSSSAARERRPEQRGARRALRQTRFRPRLVSQRQRQTCERRRCQKWIQCGLEQDDLVESEQACERGGYRRDPRRTLATPGARGHEDPGDCHRPQRDLDDSRGHQRLADRESDGQEVDVEG